MLSTEKTSLFTRYPQKKLHGSPGYPHNTPGLSTPSTHVCTYPIYTRIAAAGPSIVFSRLAHCVNITAAGPSIVLFKPLVTKAYKHTGTRIYSIYSTVTVFLYLLLILYTVRTRAVDFKFFLIQCI